MINKNLAKIFYEMSELLEMEEVPFKPQAYAKAAQSLEALDKDIELKPDGSLKEKIPGVGKNIAEKIEEYIKTGKIKAYQKLKKKMPVNISELTSIEGVGPKLIKLFYKKLKIRNLKDLERAAKAGKLAKLPRAGEKLQDKILKGIEFHKKSHGRFRLGDVYNLAKKLEEKYQGTVAGSFRRQQETVGDLDILIETPSVSKSLTLGVKKGQKRKTIRFSNGLKSDLRFIDKKSWGSALQYFTGNKAHNIALRKIAMKKGYKLNEYGLFKNKKQIAGKTEKEIYNKLGLQYIPPEMRENTGELALRQAQGKPKKLPKLVKERDIKGDLHVHSHWLVPSAVEGKTKVKERIKKAKELGCEYIGISDHTKFLAIEHGLNEQDLLKQAKEIARLNSKSEIRNPKLKILHGCETNILADGSIDIDNKALAKLDYVMAGVHSQLKMPKKEMTERIIKAMENPHVDIIAHPTNRVIGSRPESEMDFDKILKVAKETGTVLEINANPSRLDLRDVNIRKAKEAGVKMIIGTDSHQNDQMDFMKFGIGQARRGWVTKKDIINSWPYKKLKEFFRKPKAHRVTQI